MWLLNTEVPPDQANAFFELVSPDPQDPTYGGSARTRRGARQKRAPQTPSAAKMDAELAASDIVRKIGSPRDPVTERMLLYKIQREILAGYMNPDYWIVCPLLSEDFLSDEPDSVPDPAPRPYAYRTGGNLPTLATYHNGITDTGPASYRGFLTANYFHDNRLVWARRLYQLNAGWPDGKLVTTWHTFEGSLSIDTDARGSRPMCSVIMKFLLLNHADHPLQHDASPTTTPLSFYWRFHPPLGAAPYYHVTQPVRLMSSVADLRNVATAGVIDRCLVLSAPRPMFGYGQNNCSEIDTVLTGTQKIYQIDPCLGFRGAFTVWYHDSLGNTPFNETHQLTRDSTTTVWDLMRADLATVNRYNQNDQLVGEYWGPLLYTRAYDTIPPDSAGPYECIKKQQWHYAPYSTPPTPTLVTWSTLYKITPC